MGAIYRGILDRIEPRDYDVFSAVVRVPRPRRALIAATTWATDVHLLDDDGRPMPPDVVRRGRRLRRAERGGARWLSGAARARARSAAASSAAARRRSSIARPASSSTTGSTCCSAAIAKRSRSSGGSAPKATSGCSRRSTSRTSTRSAGARCCAVRRCRRRCTCWRPSSLGRAAAGGIGSRVLRLARPLLAAPSRAEPQSGRVTMAPADD